MESKDCGGGGERAAEFVTFVSGGSRMCAGIVMFCRAIIVAEGGVFSPRMALWEGRRAGVSLISKRAAGDGVPFREGLRSASLPK